MDKTLSNFCLVARTNDIPTVDLDGEIGMLNIETGKYYAFDTIGTRIWELTVNPIIINDLVQNLLKEYEIDERTCQEDVLFFLNKLLQENLIKVIEE